MTTEILGMKQENYAGDMVLNEQEMSTDFTHVSKIWRDECISIDDGMEKMSQAQRIIHDIRSPLSDFQSIIENNKYGWQYKPTGKVYFPTYNALANMGILGKASTWAVQSLAGNNEDDKIKRDIRDVECLKHYLDIHIFQADRMDLSKERLYRTWDDGTMRAVLSNQYIIINNNWILEQIKQIIPDGLLSHWRSNPDELYCNILIPDSIRAEKDSDYGGMLSVGNSEIGTGRLSTRPSVFRAICMNGCIWDEQQGKALNKVHKGKNFDIAGLGKLIQENLNRQIPLLNSGIDNMMKLQNYKFDSVNNIQMIGQAAMEFGITPKQTGKIVEAFNIEQNILNETVKTAFGLQAAITRAGQQLSNDEWVKFDVIGGQILSMTTDRWERFVNRAKNLTDKELVKFGLAV